MKKITFITLLMAFLLTGLYSCSKEDYTGSSGPGGTASTSYIITQGTWRVTYFSNNGTDETSNYGGFTFRFMVNGTITASNSLLNVNGTWNSYNDDSQNKLLLGFENVLQFPELAQDWHIVERISNKLRMEHISGGAGGTDYLTIEKN